MGSVHYYPEHVIFDFKHKLMSSLEDDLQLDNEYLGNEKVPNSGGILALGIISIIPGCFCYALPGVICGIIALVMASKSLKLIEENPTRYTDSSIQQLKAGKVCAIIGLSLSSLFFLFIILYAIIMGSFFFSMLSMGVQ